MKRTLSLVLAFCLVFSLFTGILISGAGAITYTDVSKDFWAYNEIYYLTDKGILAGDGTGKFRPNDSVTHIEFIKMIVAAFNLSDATSVSYTNVPQWAKDGKYLEKAAAQGFLLPSYTTNFDFSSKLSREEAVALIMRYLDLDSSYAAPSSRYPDYNEIDSAYRDYALIATGAGIVRGDDTGKFQPKRILTRSEALRILYVAAGAIYDVSANRADTGNNSDTATVNHSVTLSGITFTGNVYVTEGATNVTFEDCFIRGKLFVRGKTNLVLDDTVVSEMAIEDGGTMIMKDGASVTSCKVYGTAGISVDEKSSIQKLLFMSGSKNSSVDGKGVVTNVAVQDTGIELNGVTITEYYVYSGYTVKIDGVKYEAGSGKPTKGSVVSATVYGSIGLASNVITITVTTNQGGIIYAAAWPNTTAALTAEQIKSAASTAATATATIVGTYKQASANVATTLTLTVPNTVDRYNVGFVFVPTGTTSVTGLKPYYNTAAVTAAAANMTQEAPAAVKSTAPTWSATAGPTNQQNNTFSSIILTFDQEMYIKSGTASIPNTKLTESAQDLTKLFTVNQYNASTKRYDIPIAVVKVSFPAQLSTSTDLQVQLDLGSACGIGNNYQVILDASLVNAQGYGPSNRSIEFNASVKVKTEKPTLSPEGGNVTAESYVQIGFPTGVTQVAYSVTVDGKLVVDSQVLIDIPATYQRIYFNKFSGYVIKIEAWAIDSNGSRISEIATGTYYLGIMPEIKIDGNSFYGTGSTNIYRTDKDYKVETSEVPAGYTATYAVDSMPYTSIAATWRAPAANSTTGTVFTMTLTPNVIGGANSAVTTSVTVVYGRSGSSTTPSTKIVEPVVTVKNLPVSPIPSTFSVYEASAPMVISIPGVTAYTYEATLTGPGGVILFKAILTVGADTTPITLGDSTTTAKNQTYTLRITAKDGTTLVAEWNYTVILNADWGI